VRLKESTLSDAQKRYSDARIEIQVASVLMHAWSEVEHDLVYKPLQGHLSEAEYAILDELNGLVLAGEIALERLQRAVEMRVAKRGTTFTNQYDLAAYLFEAVKSILASAPTEPAMGRVDVLFEFLSRLELNSAEAVEPYIAALQPNLERRPIAEQIIDQILAADASRYAIYEEVREERDAYRSYESKDEALRAEMQHRALGVFLRNWIALETALREIGKSRNIDERQGLMPTGKLLERLQVLSLTEAIEFGRLQRMRNALVHRDYDRVSSSVEGAADAILTLLRRLAADPHPDVSVAAQRALNWLDGVDAENDLAAS
jgi:hypothetical protein